MMEARVGRGLSSLGMMRAVRRGTLSNVVSPGGWGGVRGQKGTENVGSSEYDESGDNTTLERYSEACDFDQDIGDGPLVIEHSY